MLRLYSLYTPSHRVLKERFFAPTIPPDLDLRLHYFENAGAGVIHDPSFCRAIIRKCEVIVAAIRENWGDTFVWCDVDAQFFGSITDAVSGALDGVDIAFQVDAPGPALCDGLFACRANERTLDLWQQTLEFVRLPQSAGDDQLRVRQLVGVLPGLRWCFLPLNFIGGGTFTARLWEPGQPLCVPEDILVHHANFTIGVANKVRQCELVRQKLAAGDLLPAEEACRRVHANERLRRFAAESARPVAARNSSL